MENSRLEGLAAYALIEFWWIAAFRGISEVLEYGIRAIAKDKPLPLLSFALTQHKWLLSTVSFVLFFTWIGVMARLRTQHASIRQRLFVIPSVVHCMCLWAILIAYILVRIAYLPLVNT
jgi:hypothetical protein